MIDVDKVLSTTFDYRVQWPSDQIRQGEHRSSSSGDGGAYRGDRLLREVRDARHLSMRATLCDPFGRLWVREFLHSATTDLWIFADASGSMRTGSQVAGRSGVEIAGRLVRSAALSARSVGDRVGVYCAANAALPPCCSPPSRLPAQSLAVGQRIESLAGVTPDAPANRGAGGLLKGLAGLGPRKSLVFLVSDFYPDRCDWHALMSGLAAHDVVPVVVWNLPDTLAGARQGLMSLRDAETGRDVMVWMRRSLKRRIMTRLDEHFDACERLCRQYGRRAIHLYDGFDAMALTRYFYGAPQAMSPGIRFERCKPVKKSDQQ